MPAFDQLPAIVIVYASVVLLPALKVAPVAIERLERAVFPLNVVFPVLTVKAPIVSVPKVAARVTLPFVVIELAL